MKDDVLSALHIDEDTKDQILAFLRKKSTMNFLLFLSSLFTTIGHCVAPKKRPALIALSASTATLWGVMTLMAYDEEKDAAEMEYFELEAEAAAHEAEAAEESAESAE